MANGANYPPADGQGDLSDGRYSLRKFIEKLESSETNFSKDFARAVKDANWGIDQAAIDCVESWFEPTDTELLSYGLRSNRIHNLKRCTDANLMLYATLKKRAPEVFQ